MSTETTTVRFYGVPVSHTIVRTPYGVSVLKRPAHARSGRAALVWAVRRFLAVWVNRAVRVSRRFDQLAMTPTGVALFASVITTVFLLLGIATGIVTIIHN